MFIYDLSSSDYFDSKQEIIRCKKLCHQINKMSPYSRSIKRKLSKLMQNRLPQNSTILPPVYIDRANCITIGYNVFINYGFNCIARGGIDIDDNVMIAPNVTILTTNHDYHKRNILYCKKVHIKNNAWIGSGSIILPGVTIGVNSVVGAGSVVTKDVDDNCVVAGNPAQIIKKLI
jgi:acetyltransferase-like isoleucine patch superfamily enzyme